jgi:hypothetical protein
MGTSPSVIMGRAYPSNNIFNVQPMGGFFDEIEKVKRPPEYLDFNTPPLALVIAMLELGKNCVEILEILIGTDRNNIDLKTVVTVQHQNYANEIYSHFAKKHTMRRLKGEHISEWMLAVDDLCENRKRIDKEHIKVLVTLPKFFDENQQFEPMLRKNESFPIKKQWPEKLELDLEFVQKIQRRASKAKYNDFYWKTKNNHLVRFRLEPGNVGTSAWDYLSKLGKIQIKTENCKPVRVQGYDFWVLQPNTNTEITVV